MERLCERPGCSDRASVSYGMRPADLVFWLDALRADDDDGSHGVLCRRHADSMVVPRNWTLDDQRDPDLHLFRPPAPAPTAARPRRAPARRASTEQMELGIEGDDDPETASGTSTANSTSKSPDTSPDAAADSAPEIAAAVAADGPATDPADRPVAPWSPAFDSDDDLDGLLAARSPLLARAFRGADRRHPT